MADPRETGIRVSASFPAAVGHTHWDGSSSDPALPLRGLTRERLWALDAGPHVASSAGCCPPNPFGRRSADRLTRLLPAGSGHSRQDQTNLGHGAPLRSDDTDAFCRSTDRAPVPSGSPPQSRSPRPRTRPTDPTIRFRPDPDPIPSTITSQISFQVIYKSVSMKATGTGLYPSSYRRRPAPAGRSNLRCTDEQRTSEPPRKS